MHRIDRIVFVKLFILPNLSILFEFPLVTEKL